MTTDPDDDSGLEDFREAFRADLPEEERRRGKVMTSIRRKYLRTERDARLEKELFRFIDATLGEGEYRPEGRCFAVVGESGTGKTWALHRLFKRPAFRPRADRLPLLVIRAPKPCTLKQLGRTLLHAMGYAVDRDLLEHITWERVRVQLALRGVHIVWIDEMHHALKGADLDHLHETIKNVMQQQDHPVNFVFSGTPDLYPFLDGNYQIFRRKELFVFENLSFPEDVKTLRFAIDEIVVAHAGMTLAEALGTDEFVARLCHAAARRFGMVVVLVRMAVEHALHETGIGTTVRVADFAAGYSKLSGAAEASMNPFLATDWTVIDTTRLAVPDDAYERAEPTKRKR